MNLHDLKGLLDYHYWARDRMIDAVAALTPDEYSRDLGSSFRSVRDTMVHLYSAEWAWHERWHDRSPTAQLNPDQFPDVAALRRAWADNERNVRRFLEALGEEGTTRVFMFKMLSGQAASVVFWQMLQHMVNHGSYHRGQVTTMLRQLGAAPAKSMDMVAFYQEAEKLGRQA
jgi:uncharacterized damage-inducible protein DinB